MTDRPGGGMPAGSLMIQRFADIQIVEFLETRVQDQVQVEKISRELNQLVDMVGDPKLIISFENVSHITSAMLGVLIALNKKVKAKQGEMRLAAIPAKVMEVFTLTRLDKLLKIYKNTDEAMKKF